MPDVIMPQLGETVTEGTITNLFVCLRGRLRTPAAGRLLPGIARARLLQAGHPVEEENVRSEDLVAADEAFLTNAVRGAIPLLAWEGVPLRRGSRWRAAMTAIFDGG